MMTFSTGPHWLNLNLRLAVPCWSMPQRTKRVVTDHRLSKSEIEHVFNKDLRTAETTPEQVSMEDITPGSIEEARRLRRALCPLEPRI